MPPAGIETRTRGSHERSGRRWARRFALVVVVVAAAFLAGPSAATAVDLFVDDDHPNGNDAGPCTAMNAPCLTIGAAVGVAGAGDTVRIGGGTYNESITLGDGKSPIGDDFLGGATTKASAAAKTKLKTKKVTVSLTGGETKTVKLKLSKKKAKKLKKATKSKKVRKKTKITAKATATDLGGNTETEKSKHKLK